jgi:hypothetical protein
MKNLYSISKVLSIMVFGCCTSVYSQGQTAQIPLPGSIPLNSTGSQFSLLSQKGTYIRPQVISTLNMLYLGDSNCVAVGSQGLNGAAQATQGFPALDLARWGSGTSSINCVSGTTTADTLNAQLFKFNGGLFPLSPYGGSVTIFHDGTNDAKNASALTANFQGDFNREKWAEGVVSTVPMNAMLLPTTSGIYSGSGTLNYTYPAFPWLTVSGSTTFSITTYGGPIYIAYPAFDNDTGTWTVSVNGNSATDTITGLTTIPNSPLNGVANHTGGGVTQTPMLARFVSSTPGTPTAPVTQSVTITVGSSGTNGIGLFFAATSAQNTDSYLPNIAAFDGLEPQQGNAQGTNTATYDTMINTVATGLANDGLPVLFSNIRVPLLQNLTAAYSSTDGVTADGFTLTDITTLAGSAVTCSATHFFSASSIAAGIAANNPLQMFVENAATSTTANYSTVLSLAPATITVPGPGGGNTSNCVNLATANTLAIAGTATAFVGFAGQIFNAVPTASVGLHHNNLGAWLESQVHTALLQSVVPGPTPTSLNLNAGQAYNINGNQVASILTSGLPNPAFLVGNYTTIGLNNGLYGMTTGGDGTNMFTDVFAPNNTSSGVRLCTGFVLTTAAKNCPYKFSVNQATFTRPVSLSGLQVNSTGSTAASTVYGGTVSTSEFNSVLYNAASAPINALLLPTNGVSSAQQTTAGVGMTPGTYTVNASSGAAQVSVVVATATTLGTITVLATGAAYGTAPTFTLPTGSTPAVLTGTLSTPAAGQRYTFKKTDSSANAVTIVSGAGSLDGVTGGTITLSQNQAATVWFDATNGWKTESLFQANAASTGLSGMTTGQVPIAATATTVTSSKPISGAGAGLTSGPTTATATDIPVFTSTTGGLVDSGIAISSLCQTSGTNCPASSSYSLGGTLSNSNVVVGAGAGTGATAALVGQDGNHLLQITTGLAPNNTALYATVTFTASRGRVTYCLATPASASSAALLGVSAIFLSSSASTQYLVSISGAALAPSTNYEWDVSCP